MLRLLAVLTLALTLAAPTWAASKPPHYSLWMCVHRQEHSAWTDDDSPYWGGLQMGQWFIDTYAPARLLKTKGYPHRWTPLEQMWVAENAYKREGYSRSWLYGQWPPSRGVCF